MSVTSSHFEGMRFLSQTSLQYRAREVEAALDRMSDRAGDWRVIDVARRNRGLHDMYHLLKGDWQFDPEIKFYEAIEPEQLGDQKFPPEVAQLAMRLEQQIIEARRTTAKSFDQFMAAAPDKFDDIADFEHWYVESLPYVTVGLDQARHAEARTRLKKMLQRHFDNDTEARWESLFLDGLRHFHEHAPASAQA